MPKKKTMNVEHFYERIYWEAKLMTGIKVVAFMIVI
jgi:hypothetical protein